MNNDERIEPETLAAFLDGTLSASDRERVVHILAQGGAAYEDFLEAEALQKALEAGTEAPPALTSPPPEAKPNAPVSTPHGTAPREATRLWKRASRWAPTSFLAAASVVALVMLQLRDRRASTARVADVVAPVAAAANGKDPGTVFGNDWDQVNWSTTRGSQPSLDERVHAFRLGVRFVDFAVAVSGQSADPRRAMGQALAALASSAETGTPVAARIEALANDSLRHPTAGELIIVSDDLRQLVTDPAWFDLASWTESARLALRAKQTTFFEYSGAPMGQLRLIVSQFDSSSTATPDDLIQPLRRLVEQRLPSLAAIGPVLDSTIAQGGRSTR